MRRVLLLLVLLSVVFFSGCTEQKSGGAVRSLSTVVPSTIAPTSTPVPSINTYLPETGVCNGKDRGTCKIYSDMYKFSDKAPNPVVQTEYSETVSEQQERFDNLQKYLKGDKSIKERDFVAVTRWAGPKGTRPLTKAEAEAGKKIRPFSSEKRYSNGDKGRNNLVYVLVNQDTYGPLATELAQFVLDLETDGYDVELYTVTYSNPEDLRAFLQQAPGLKGAILIGDLPAAWYIEYLWGAEEFPLDLFYMDLDGTWSDWDQDGLYDEHSGNKEAEIWIGRIDATTLSGDKIGLYKNYFRKNHEYRTQTLKLPKRALAYVDDDWYNSGEQWKNDLQSAYPYVHLIRDKLGTNRDDYMERLTWDYEWVSVFAHSWPGGHGFASHIYDSVYSEDIEAIDPHGLFYNLFACSAAKFSEYDYLAGKYLFANSYGVAVLGSTKSGSMLEFDEFYSPLSGGENLGESLRDWFNAEVVNTSFTNPYVLDWVISWHYGMVLLGDPTLRLKPNEYPIAEIGNMPDYGRFGGNLEIIGTAKGGFLTSSNFSHFNLSAGYGLKPDNWLTQAINLTQNNTDEVVNGFLGSIDTTRLSEGLNVVKLASEGSGLKTDYRTVIFVDNVYLNVSRLFYRRGDVVPLIGTAYGTNFLHYGVVWGTGENPSQWFSSGIMLVGNGNTEVQDSLLGYLDTSQIDADEYLLTVKLQVFYSGNGSVGVKEDVISIVVDPDYVAGWPLKTEYGLINVHPLLVEDINGDGLKEIMYQEWSEFGFGTKTHALGYNGQDIAGWPLDNLEPLRTVPSVIDVNKDGRNEIVFTTYCTIYCFSGNGTWLWSDSTACGDGYHFNPPSVPIVSDLDQDGADEIFVIAWGSCGGNTCSPYIKLYALNSDGSLKWSREINKINIPDNNPPVVGDVDGDGSKEIFFGGYSSVNGKIMYYLINPQGNDYPSWPMELDGVWGGGFRLADINGDIKDEMIFSMRNDHEPNGQIIHALDHAGNELPGWPVPTDNYSYIKQLIISDLFGYNEPQIIAYDPNDSGRYEIFFSNGTKFNEKISKSGSSSITLDHDGDGIKGLFKVNSYYYFYGPDDKYEFMGFNLSGNDVVGFPKLVGNYRPHQYGNWDYTELITPIASDINNDGWTDLIVGTGEYIYVWTFDDVFREENSDWPQFHHDSQHTGRYVLQSISNDCGDANSDGEVNQLDLLMLTNALHSGETHQAWWSAMDADGSGDLSIADYLRFQEYKYFGGPKPTCTSTDSSKFSVGYEESISAYGNQTSNFTELTIELVNNGNVTTAEFEIAYNPVAMSYSGFTKAGRLSLMNVDAIPLPEKSKLRIFVYNYKSQQNHQSIVPDRGAILKIQFENGGFIPGSSPSVSTMKAFDGLLLRMRESPYQSWCGTVPSGSCNGYLLCQNGVFVANRCEACGCPSGQQCVKTSGVYKCLKETSTAVPIPR